jgi:MoaA/NifB/PqqE/SkfB family radical SAM enzyme
MVHNYMIKNKNSKICWRINRQCNLNCKHCLSGNRTRNYNEMTTEEIIKVLNILKQNGVKEISFTGGEPLLKNDIMLVLKHAFNMGFKLTLTTNGLLVDEKWIKFIKQYISKLKISLDGLKEQHNYLRNADVFDKTIAVISDLIKNQINLEINCTVTKINTDTILEYFELLKTLNIKNVSFLRFLPRENGAENKYLEINDADFSCFIQKIEKYNLSNKYFKIKVSDYGTTQCKRLMLESDGTLLFPGKKESEDVLAGNMFSLNHRFSEFLTEQNELHRFRFNDILQLT